MEPKEIREGKMYIGSLGTYYTVISIKDGWVSYNVEGMKLVGKPTMMLEDFARMISGPVPEGDKNGA